MTRHFTAVRLSDMRWDRAAAQPGAAFRRRMGGLLQKTVINPAEHAYECD